MSTDTYVRPQNLIELDESVCERLLVLLLRSRDCKEWKRRLDGSLRRKRQFSKFTQRSKKVPAARRRWFSPGSAGTASDRPAPPGSGLA